MSHNFETFSTSYKGLFLCLVYQMCQIFGIWHIWESWWECSYNFPFISIWDISLFYSIKPQTWNRHLLKWKKKKNRCDVKTKQKGLVTKKVWFFKIYPFLFLPEQHIGNLDSCDLPFFFIIPFSVQFVLFCYVFFFPHATNYNKSCTLLTFSPITAKNYTLLTFPAFSLFCFPF